MAKELLIKKAESGDIPTIVEYLRFMMEEMASTGGHQISKNESEWGNLNEYISKELMNQEHIFIMAKRAVPSMQSVGFVEARIKTLSFMFEPKRILHIHSLYVDKTNRRVGIGRALLESAIEWGQGLGCEEVELSVLIGNSAQSLYKKLGFQTCELEMLRKL